METSPVPYSSFLPLQILIISIGAWLGYHVFVLNEERLGAEARIQQLLPPANASLAAKNRLISLAQEVNQLAARDPAAAQVVNEFNIRAQNPPQSESDTIPASK